jgi:hypothetical protein
LINALTWSTGFCGERGKRGGMVGKNRGPWQRNVAIVIFNGIFFGGLNIQLLAPLGKAHKAHFLASMWCKESREAYPPSICLDHIKAHETYHLFHALPLKLAPTCFVKQCGTSRTQEFECVFAFLVYQLICLEFAGLWYIIRKVLRITFQRYITRPKTIKNHSCKTKKQKCSHLVTVHQGGQKNYNGKKLWLFFAYISTILNRIFSV